MMVARRSTYFDGDNEGIKTPEWSVDARKCPFDELPIRFCGCPEGERLLAQERQDAEAEQHLERGYN